MAAENQPDKKGARRRRSERLKIRVPIEVRTQSGEKMSASERTDALIVNAHGALVLLAMDVQPNQFVIILNLRTGDELLSRVTSLGPRFMGKTEVGIEFIKPAPDFWGVTAAAMKK
jgi:hypothetical protein